MLIITYYGLSTIRSDWNKIKMIPVKVRITNDLRLWIAGVDVTIDNEPVGQTNELGEVTALIAKPGNIHILARENPYHPLDTTISLSDKGLDISFLMSKPFAALKIIALTESGEPVKDANIVLNKKEIGKTDESGSLLISETLHLQDSVEVRLSKDGYENRVDHIYLADASQNAGYTMVKKTTPATPPKPTPKPAPTPDFQSHYDLANQHLDKAIAGDAKFYGRALNEINTAISSRPKYVPAKQLKVEILYNFAKTLRDSKLYNEAANRCGEALKVYRDIPEDQMFLDIQKLKGEIDKKLN
jgi:tetratricopeptide (TPR) repeat protein